MLLCTDLCCREALTGQAAVHSVSADIDQKICFSNSANYLRQCKLLCVCPYNTLDLKLAIPYISIPQFKTLSDNFRGRNLRLPLLWEK